jgi:hypothetical protein
MSSPRSHGGALTAGLILIALGVIFLIEGFYTPFSAWRLLARYWPIIPIIIGLKKIFAYFTWQASPSARDKAPSKE